MQILFAQCYNNFADTSIMQVLFAQFHNNSADTFTMQVLFAQCPALFITNIMVVRLQENLCKTLLTNEIKKQNEKVNTPSKGCQSFGKSCQNLTNEIKKQNQQVNSRVQKVKAPYNGTCNQLQILACLVYLYLGE